MNREAHQEEVEEGRPRLLWEKLTPGKADLSVGRLDHGDRRPFVPPPTDRFIPSRVGRTDGTDVV